MKSGRWQATGLFIALALAASASCGRSNATAPVSRATLETLPPTATVTPGPTEDPGLIAPIIDALRSGNPEAIRTVIGYGFSQLSCSSVPASQETATTSSCSNTPERAFFYGTCEGTYLRPADIQQVVDAMTAMKLYAVYRVPPEFRSAAQYSAILIDQRSERSGQAWEAIIDNEHIVALIFSCTTTAEKLIELRHYKDAILLPQTP